MALPDVREKLTGMGAEPLAGQSDELTTLLRSETTVWGKVIRDGNITPQ